MKNSTVLLTNSSAKDLVKTLAVSSPEITKWNRLPEVFGYFFYISDQKICCFALLHKTRDTMRTQHKPCILDYVYTFNNFRRRGYALKLLQQIKETEEVSVFSLNEISNALFSKAKFIKIDKIVDVTIFRYP